MVVYHFIFILIIMFTIIIGIVIFQRKKMVVFPVIFHLHLLDGHPLRSHSQSACLTLLQKGDKHSDDWTFRGPSRSQLLT